MNEAFAIVRLDDAIEGEAAFTVVRKIAVMTIAERDLTLLAATDQLATGLRRRQWNSFDFERILSTFPV